MRFYLRANRRSRVTVGITAVIVAMLSLATIALATQQILSAGPLTRVLVTDQLNCAVSHTGDSSGEFYGDTACGTFVTVGGVLFGPSSVPAGGGASPRTAWTQVSQSAVTGSGTALDPYRIVTVADAGTTGIRVTETDSYTVGQEAYRTDVALSNSGGAGQNVIVYRAADCYLQNSDSGYGRPPRPSRTSASRSTPGSTRRTPSTSSPPARGRAPWRRRRPSRECARRHSLPHRGATTTRPVTTRCGRGSDPNFHSLTRAGAPS